MVNEIDETMLQRATGIALLVCAQAAVTEKINVKVVEHQARGWLNDIQPRDINEMIEGIYWHCASELHARGLWQ